MCAIIFAAKELEYGWVQGLMDLQTGWGRILPLIKGAFSNGHFNQSNCSEDLIFEMMCVESKHYDLAVMAILPIQP